MVLDYWCAYLFPVNCTAQMSTRTNTSVHLHSSLIFTGMIVGLNSSAHPSSLRTVQWCEGDGYVRGGHMTFSSCGPNDGQCSAKKKLTQRGYGSCGIGMLRGWDSFVARVVCRGRTVRQSCVCCYLAVAILSLTCESTELTAFVGLEMQWYFTHKLSVVSVTTHSVLVEM